jgi:hypothetical protein
MKNFISEYAIYRKLSPYGYYRFCWIKMKNGGGIFSTIEFFDYELPKIDTSKIEIIQL